MKFSEMNLTGTMMSGLNDIRFNEPTPVQEKAIPLVLEGKDVIATAQTGTGKTGAFIIPIMDRILKGEQDGIKALILSPTRELAQQIDEQIFAIGYHTGISSATVIGGSDFSVQAKALNAGVDIIVATPGRLIDQKKIVNIDFSKIDYLVLDEADRMLDMGFLPDMKKIIGWLPEERQTLLFSATMPPEIEKLASGIMKNPEPVEIARAKAPTLVEQRAFFVRSNQKIPLLKKIFKTIQWDSCIIFTSTKKGTDELQRLLKKEGIKAASIHGDRSQEERNRSLNAFKSGEFPVIVATNVLARGIDIKDVSMIVNYDTPHNTDDYIHRIGRTGRYDKSGIAVTFVTQRDKRLFKDIDNIKENPIKKINLPDGFNEKSDFYWDGKEQPRKKSKDDTKDSSDKHNKNRRPKRNKSEKKEESDQDSKGKSKKRSSGKNQNSSSPSGKNDKQEKADKKSRTQPASSSGNGTEKKEKKSASTNNKPSSGEPKSNEPEKDTSTVAVPISIPKAAERNKNSRKPAKGVWGIIKSFIPKFKQN
ncbi:MAG: DEAD/DEAH box helicase [Balneolaceae bacterium]